MSSQGLSRLSRRDFLKYCAATAALLGLSDLETPRIAAALEAAAKGKTPLLWLKAQGCKGCAVSLLNCDEPSPGQIILDSFAIRFFSLLTAASGELAMASLDETATRHAGQYVLLVEGSIPLGADGAYATMGFDRDEPIALESWLPRLAKGAKATLAIGTCAGYGGIPVLFEQADVRSVEAVIGEPTPVVPGCPPHPDWIVGTLVKLLLFGREALLGQLDGERRLKEFFSQLVHDNCPRRTAFDAGIFLDDFNDSLNTDNACLLRKGCRGPFTHADCPLRRWNQRMNWCIGAGAPCNGCTEPAFYAGLAPLYETLPSVKVPNTRPIGVSADVIGAAAGAAAAVGVGVHLVAQVATGRLGKLRAPGIDKTVSTTEPAPSEVTLSEEAGHAAERGISADRAVEEQGLQRKADGTEPAQDQPVEGEKPSTGLMRLLAGLGRRKESAPTEGMPGTRATTSDRGEEPSGSTEQAGEEQAAPEGAVSLPNASGEIPTGYFGPKSKRAGSSGRSDSPQDENDGGARKDEE